MADRNQYYDRDRQQHQRDSINDRYDNEAGSEEDRLDRRDRERDDNQFDPYSRQSQYDRTRQWRGRSGQHDYTDDQNDNDNARRLNRGETGRFDRGQNSIHDRNYDRIYGTDQERQGPRYRESGREWTPDYQDNRGQGDWRARQTNQVYNRDWYDWDYDQDYRSENDYNRDRGFRRDWAGEEFNRYNQPRDWRENFNEDSQRDWRNRAYRPGGRGSTNPGNYNPYPSAGMNSDYGQPSNYETRDRYSEQLNYQRGDIGYESEGAFYQDLDEPVNYEYWEVWMIPGEHTGRGPANYTRTDSRIEEDVCERLTDHGRIDASEIEVMVRDGEVTLRGSVPNREMKRLAEDIAENITGVQDIHNELKVQKENRDLNRSYGFNRGRENPRTGDYTRQGDYNRQIDDSRDRFPDRASNSESDQRRKQSGDTGDREAFSPVPGTGFETESTSRASSLERGTGQDENKHPVREGMEVIGKQGRVIGRVKEIRSVDFLVDRDMARDVYVPLESVQSVGVQVMLNINADEVDNQGWEKPNLL